MRQTVSAEMLATVSPRADDSVRDALQAGRNLDALRSAIEQQDLELAVDILRIAWFDVVGRAGSSDVIDLLETLTYTQLVTHPLLAMTLGLVYNGDGFRRSKAIHYFGIAAAGVRSHSGRIPASERAIVLASESAALRLVGKNSMSVSSARSALRALETIGEQRSSFIGYLPRVYAQLGTSLYYGGQEREALQVFARGYAERGASDLSSFANLAMPAGIHALEGNIGQAEEFVLLARGEPWTDEQRRMYVGTFYRIAEAILALERGDPRTARVHLEAMEHDRRSIEHWTVIAHVEALTSLLEGDAAGGLAGLEEYSALRDNDGDARAARRRLSSIRSLLHIALGNFEAAQRVLRDDAGKRPQDHVDRARLALATDRTGEALRELRTIAGRPQSLRTRAEALAIEAALGLRAELDRRATTVVRELVALLRRTGQRVALQLLSPRDARALAEALRTVGDGDLVDGKASPALFAESETVRLTARELATLNALARSGSVRDIADELGVTVNTAKTHLKHLYRKLRGRNREEALAAAFHHHLIAPPESSASES